MVREGIYQKSAIKRHSGLSSRKLDYLLYELKMNERLVLLASLYLTVAVALLHTSLAQTPLPVLQVTYNFGGMPERVSLECMNVSSGLLQNGATYKFKDPEGREEDRSFDVVGRSYEFTNHPTNESLITCTLKNVESEPVRVVGMSNNLIMIIEVNNLQFNMQLFLGILLV